MDFRDFLQRLAAAKSAEQGKLKLLVKWQFLEGQPYGRIAIFSIWDLPPCDLSHSSTISVLIANPIQNAIPKNC